jgi:iron complex outermembrane recepter protein
MKRINFMALVVFRSLLLGAATFALAPNLLAQEATQPNAGGLDDIIVTATKRASPLSNVPIAVTAIGGEALQNSGASDIRQLNQLAPSLLVSSTSSEAGGGTARIRGVGTVGDNPGLESSVTTFIDGVYRSRSGIGLTELGNIERIEVLRGPQGTLFGRNASSGLINVVTKGPKPGSFEGYANASYGNYNYINASGGVNVPLGDTMAARLDGAYTKRDGFLKDVVSGRDINNRDRWLIRGQIGFEPTDNIKVRLIGDYAKRREECCGASYFNAEVVTRDANNGITVTSGSSTAPTISTIRIDSPRSSTVNENGAAGRAVNIAQLLRSLGGIVNDDPTKRLTAITDGQNFRSDVDDWGVSAQVDWDLDAIKLTSITAYRDWKFGRGQDADVLSNLDILNRTDWRQQFKTFSQELRLQGNISIVDWLVGGYYSDEKLTFSDNLTFGADYGKVNACNLVYAIGAGAFASPNSPGCLAPAARGPVGAGFGPAAPLILGALDRLSAIANVGLQDSYLHKSTNWAIFTHNVINFTDRLNLTVGVRYTQERKKLDATFNSNNTACFDQAQAMARFILKSDGGSADATGALAPLAFNLRSLACVGNIGAIPNGSIATQRISENRWSGTAVLSYKVIDDLLTYASYSKGYKAGGFNLDRSGFNGVDATQLQFRPEKVDAYELGAKYSAGRVNMNVALYYQDLADFQLNTFNGINFLVKNVPASARGAEIEFQARPVPELTLNAGAMIGKTKYGSDITFSSGTEANALFLLPNSVISNAPRYVVSGGATYEKSLGSSGMTGVLYGDFRYQGDINTGSDLFPEKEQEGFLLVNARIGIYGEDKRWGIEAWAQNLLNKNYSQVGFNAPLQGSGSIASVQSGRAESANQLFGNFLGEPRTFGVTARYKF